MLSGTFGIRFYNFFLTLNMDRPIKLFAIFVLAIIAGTSCSDRHAEEISYPFIHSSLYDFTDITKVELTDSATVVFFSSNFIPNFEIDNDTDWKICACGNEYPAKAGIGMAPGDKIVYDGSGKKEFSVIYGPIPRRARSIDLIGGHECFCFFGVDLTGNDKEIQDRRIKYQEDLSESLPFDECIGESSIRIHLLNYKPGMKSCFQFDIGSIVGSESGAMHVDDNGEASISFSQKGSSYYQIGFAMTHTSAEGIINPGDTIDVNIDLNCFGHNIMRGREGYPDPDVHYISTTDRHLSVLKTSDKQLSLTDIFNMPDEADAAEISTARSYAGKAKNGELTKEDFQVLDGFKWKFLKTALCSIQNEVLERLTSGTYETVTEWDGAEEWMKQIIKPHEGKVVMIDLWNTWCSPCRHAISINESLKSDVLNSENLVWVYIADESSPIIEYQESVKKIRGFHYRLSKELIKELDAYLDVDGIPFYVLVEKDGSFISRPDLRDHGKYVQELLDRCK